MRILILGGDGMLGHQLRHSLAERHDVRVTVRRPLSAYPAADVAPEGVIDGVDVLQPDRLSRVVNEVAPDVLINCVGLVKQRPDAKSPVPSILVNSLLPHRLNDLCRERRARLIHFSTDCVFSGKTGGYKQTDTPDPIDLYGRTKLVGEVDQAPGLTLRTSIIGLELARKTSLIEWFLAQRGAVRGFRRAIYTGLTTTEMGRVVGRLIERHPDLHGVWHLASAPISKYDLLAHLAEKLGRRDVTITPDDDFHCDRSLRSEPFGDATGYVAPSWNDMLTALAAEVHARDRAKSA